VGFPTDVPVIDLMIQVPSGPSQDWYEFLAPLLRDQESQSYSFPAQYMFKNVPKIDECANYVDYLLAKMDQFNIERGMITVRPEKEGALSALTNHPDRFFASFEVNPNEGMDAVRKITHMKETFDIKAVSCFPAGLNPQVPINDKRMYPIYAKCVELDLPFFVTAGVPGPRVPFACQKVELLDEVCWWFPELTIVTRHGCEPWTELAVKLLLKWPNLYYSTSAFAPRYYPTDIVNFANSRGADKVLYAGYFPMGLSLDRIFSEMPDVPFNDNVWPKFLRGNAIRVLKLDS
jgi:predicted TIM-barrel fold metal-dependent hydrolase